MQLFDFRCDGCDHRFESWDTMEKSARPPCPTCQSPDTTRLISKPRLDYTGMATNMKSGDEGLTTAVDRWAKAREEKVKIEERNLRNHGTVD